MFRTVVLAPDAEFGKAVERVALESRHLTVNKTLSAFPENGYDVGRIISSYDPEILLVENIAVDATVKLAENLRAYAPNVAVLALGGQVTADAERRFEAIGASLLNGAFNQSQFIDAIQKAIHRARQNSLGHLFAFLPGKAGSGATTVAFNLATFMANGLGKKVFVLEADLHSGVMSTFLDVQPRLPLIDVLQNSDGLDYSSWHNAIVSRHSTDYLLADRIKKAPLPSWMHYHQLLQFASERYDAMIVDLPEIVNEATEEIVQYAQWTFVVCTPELASLTLARQRLQELKAHGALPDRLRIVLNRWHKSDMKPAEVSGILGHPVSVVIKNDYRVITRALSSDRPLGPESDLGRCFLEFGTKLLGAPSKESGNKARFSIF